MLVSFYRPAGSRTALLLERHAFPSDRYALESQVRHHGLDPARDLIELASRTGEVLRAEDVIETIEREGARIATILLPGVQRLTGQRLDVAAITTAGRGRLRRLGPGTLNRQRPAAVARLGRGLRGLGPAITST